MLRSLLAPQRDQAERQVLMEKPNLNLNALHERER